MKRMIGTCCAIAMGVTLGSPLLVDRASAQAKPANTQASQGAQSASKKQEGEDNNTTNLASPGVNIIGTPIKLRTGERAVRYIRANG